jgi:hypothetical protein
LKACCALDYFFLPSHILINHNGLHRLIFMGPFRLPEFDYLYTLIPLNFLGSICYCFMWFWVWRYIIHDHTFIICLLFTIHDKIIMLIGT